MSTATRQVLDDVVGDDEEVERQSVHVQAFVGEGHGAIVPDGGREREREREREGEHQGATPRLG